MSTETIFSVVEAAKFALNPTGYLIRKIASNVVEDSTNAKPDRLEDLRIEAERQALEMKMAEAKARVAQELALAQRIETAEEVEMEEFYETAADGKAGVSVEGEGLSAGISGSGRRVTKRVFRFKGVAMTQVVANGADGIEEPHA